MTTTRHRRLRALALLLVMALLAAACGGGDDESAGDDDDEASEAFDPAGVLHISANLSSDSAGANFDPAKAFSGADQMFLVYDSLLRTAPEGKVVPGLAESVVVVDPSTIKVSLKPGLKFSDGTVLDATAAKAGIMRNVTSNGPGFRAEIKEVADIVVDDATHFTVKLKTPIAGSFMLLFLGAETMIVSPKAVAAGADLTVAPVGAGAFTVESFAPGSKVVLKKNPLFHDAAEVKLAGIEMIHTGTDPVAALNGYQSGQIDVASQVQPAQLAAYKTLSDTTLVHAPSNNAWFQMFLCKNKPPFDDLKVRQALNFLVDKELLSKVVYNGESAAFEGNWPKGHPFYNPELKDRYKHDPAMAKKLLAEAGYTTTNPLKFEAFYLPGAPQQIMEILQQQFKEAGVEMSLAPTADVFGEFLQAAKRPAAGIPMQRQGTGKVTRIYGDVPTNVCQYKNPELMSVMTKLAAADQANFSDEATELWHQASEIVVDEALAIFGTYVLFDFAHKKKVGGVSIVESYAVGSPTIDLTKVFIKKS